MGPFSSSCLAVFDARHCLEYLSASLSPCFMKIMPCCWHVLFLQIIVPLTRCRFLCPQSCSCLPETLLWSVWLDSSHILVVLVACGLLSCSLILTCAVHLSGRAIWFIVLNLSPRERLSLSNSRLF